MKRILLLAFCLTALSPVCRAEQIRFTKFDQNHSTVGFVVPISGGMSEVEGKFTSFAVNFLYDTVDVTRSIVDVAIQVASINTGLPDRDDDLRSARFFDVSKYPEIRFTSTRFTKRAADLVVTGTLEMRGIRKEIELHCQIKGPEAPENTDKIFIGAAATATLNRRDFGMTWEHTVPGFVGDNIAVSIHLISKLTPR
jgi:polyisoprenoid-binding protein YceI